MFLMSFARAGCECMYGWMGDTCAMPTCGRTRCSPHGTCTAPFQCTCKKGYMGPDCSVVSGMVMGKTNPDHGVDADAMFYRANVPKSSKARDVNSCVKSAETGPVVGPGGMPSTSHLMRVDSRDDEGLQCHASNLNGINLPSPSLWL